MSFSDEQIKQLKERNLDSLGRPLAIKQSEWKALLARLEASELVASLWLCTCVGYPGTCVGCRGQKEYLAWRRSKGEGDR